MTNLRITLARSLWISCPLIAFAVMFGHMTGVINSGLALTGLGILGVVGSERRSLDGWPLVVPCSLRDRA